MIRKKHDDKTGQHDVALPEMRPYMDAQDDGAASPMSEVQTDEVGYAVFKSGSEKTKAGNIVTARVQIVGTRPLLQHSFGPDALPLEGREKTGIAGNDPEEWKRTRLVTKSGQLYLRSDYVFASIRDGAKYTKKGKGSIQSLVSATLQVIDSPVLVDRFLPKDGDPPMNDPTAPVYIDVCGVRNPSTKARNVRYRLAAAPGWRCGFTLLWDRTIVSREQMRAVLHDTGTLCGIGDGRAIGNGRFAVESFQQLNA